MTPVTEIPACDAPSFETRYRPEFRPIVIRRLATDLPLVQAGRRNPDEALGLIEQFDSGAPADVMVAPPEAKGRFFYNSDMRAFNFSRHKLPLSRLVQQLRQTADDTNPAGIYAGASEMTLHLPGMVAHNTPPMVDGMGATPRIWIGNATQVATHFDLSDNVAVVAAGKRRFTLFPPQATPDLYVGPLNITLAGQPVSMVDPLDPDRERFPRYAEAEQQAQYADLEAGDAIYIPTLWWHHVSATEPVNILLNFWHNDAKRGGGFLALIHAMLAIRDQPLAQRDAWRVWFDHFVFSEDAGSAAAHLPQQAKGVNGPSSPERDEQMRQFIIQILASR